MHRLTYPGRDGCPLAAFTTSATPVPDLPVVVFLHGGGPDHRSLIPLARRLAGDAVVVLPDVRGYGRSVCVDPARHTWSQYAEDVVSLLDHLRVPRAVVAGAGLGATVGLRCAVAYPERIAGLCLIGVEDIEDDAGKLAEIAFMDAFADRMRTQGVSAAWEPILGDLSPVIGAMVREAMFDADPRSLVAAAAIGHDRAFPDVDELLTIQAPVLIFAGDDWRHPTALAQQLARRLPDGRLGTAAMSGTLQTTADFARAFAPEIAAFLRTLAVPASAGR